jgi:hypothetical protein
MKLDDERSEDQPEEPPPPKNIVPVAIVAVATAGTVIATQLVWPGAAPAIQDGVNVFYAVMTVLLSARRRKP